MARIRIGFIAALSVLIVSACAGEFNYSPPSIRQSVENQKSVQHDLDYTWKALVSGLGKEFFVINNMEKDSGLINVSYSGDPEKFVDCGTIVSSVEGGSGKRSYQFPAARARQEYELRDGKIYDMEHQMYLEGRINILIEALSNSETSITVNTRYVLTTNQALKRGHVVVRHFSETQGFNSGQDASFGSMAKHRPGLTCRANGALEQDILRLVQ